MKTSKILLPPSQNISIFRPWHGFWDATLTNNICKVRCFKIKSIAYYDNLFNDKSSNINFTLLIFFFIFLLLMVKVRNNWFITILKKCLYFGTAGVCILDFGMGQDRDCSFLSRVFVATLTSFWHVYPRDSNFGLKIWNFCNYAPL